MIGDTEGLVTRIVELEPSAPVVANGGIDQELGNECGRLG
jgi:hypothetical protein